MPAVTEPEFFQQDRSRVDQQLGLLIDQYTEAGSQLSRAMRYSTLLGGKRIRPILVLATGRCFGADSDLSLNAACAVELIHAYSLVHDDLPAMDDDDLRRGQATCHRAFDEATAILAGDAIQSLAFEILSQPPDSHHKQSAHQLRMLSTLARASGARGMVAGQSIDLLSVGQALKIEQLEAMHRRKTGALIEASVELGALSAGDAIGEETLAALRSYARAIGLAFQVQDDILDVIGSTEELGKKQGADLDLNKPTYPALLGMDGARSKLLSLKEEAFAHLTQIETTSTSQLAEIADFVIARTR